MSFLRRLAILILFCLLGNPLSLGLLGIINRLTGCIRTVFLLYPANERYTRAYAFDWFAKKFFWNPVLLGVLRQNGRLGLTFGISATERDFLRSSNLHQLNNIHGRMEKIRRLLGANQKTFAGTLPGIMVSKEILPPNPPENRATVEAVQRALVKLRKKLAFWKKRRHLLCSGHMVLWGENC